MARETPTPHHAALAERLRAAEDDVRLLRGAVHEMARDVTLVGAKLDELPERMDELRQTTGEMSRVVTGLRVEVASLRSRLSVLGALALVLLPTVAAGVAWLVRREPAPVVQAAPPRSP